MSATCDAHLTHFDLVILLISNQQYKLYNFHHPSVTPPLLRSNILVSTRSQPSSSYVLPLG